MFCVSIFVSLNFKFLSANISLSLQQIQTVSREENEENKQDRCRLINNERVQGSSSNLNSCCLFN